MNSLVLFQSSLIPLLLITSSLLSINLQSSFCDAQTAEYANCSQPITCGTFKSNISYPFWGANRADYCGKTGFEATCQGDISMISMKNIEFRLLGMMSSSGTGATTVKVAREDYWGTICRPNYINTDLDFSLFTYASGVQNVSFYYGCNPAATASFAAFASTMGISVSSFTHACNSSFSVSYLTQTQTEKFSDPSTNGACSNVVLVPVSATATQELDNNKTTIQNAIDGGFDLNVQNDDTALCNNCVASGGVCGQNTTTTNAPFICFCQNSSSTNTTCTGNSLTNSSPGDEKWRLKLGLVVGVSVAGLVVLALAILCCSRRKLSSSFFWKKKNLEAFLTNYGPLQVRSYSYLEVKKMTNSFKEKLGQGGYGGVYKGKLKDGCLVAVKILNRSKNGEEFMNEVAAISRTSHVNIVSLLGFCFEDSKRALIYELMPNGSLEKFIFDANNPHKDRHLGWETLERISLGIARGLEYLHRGCNTRILHFDIKPHNILLDENFSPKISDFGLAKICDKKESIVSMLGARGTAGYIAPEVFCRSFGGVSHKSDVYSFGMMLSEMVGGRKNINAGAENTSEIYFPHWIYKRLELDEELGLQSIMNEEDKVRARKMIIVSLWCIQTDPSNRPAMRQVVEMLEGSVDSLQMPPKPYLSSPPKVSAERVYSSTTSVSVH